MRLCRGPDRVAYHAVVYPATESDLAATAVAEGTCRYGEAVEAAVVSTGGEERPKSAGERRPNSDHLQAVSPVALSVAVLLTASA
jgi:hypothetical protein